ncbi:hypothetical protein J6590_057582 [Homalodisca vitripennis]|nr:hypothetical protein J6590_057582 [Homalodisca vitripennis]
MEIINVISSSILVTVGPSLVLSYKVEILFWIKVAKLLLPLVDKNTATTPGLFKVALNTKKKSVRALTTPAGASMSSASSQGPQQEEPLAAYFG